MVRVRYAESADAPPWLSMRRALWALGFEEVEVIRCFRKDLSP